MNTYSIKLTKNKNLCLNSPEWEKVTPIMIDKDAWGFDKSITTEAKLLRTEDGICVKFVSDEHPVTVNTRVHGGDVYKDSCVELFIAPDKTNPGHFNLEMNAEGYIIIGFGIRRDRIRITDIDFSIFRIETNIKEDGFEAFAMLPYDFMRKYVDNIDTDSMRGNLQKCGLNPEHYLSAFPITSEIPNFHVPESFGTFILE